MQIINLCYYNVYLIFSGNLPFGTNYIVLIMSFFVVICIVFATCGGIIKFPFYLGGVELRGGRRTIPTVTSEPQVNFTLCFDYMRALFETSSVNYKKILITF